MDEKPAQEAVVSPLPRRRTFWWFLASLFLLPAGLLGIWQLSRRAAGRVIRCFVTLGDDFAVVLADPQQLEALVLGPIRVAKPDMTGSEWRVFGDLILQYENGTIDDYWLFTPFGYFLRNSDDQHLVTDFSELKAEIGKRIKGMTGMEQVRLRLENR